MDRLGRRTARPLVLLATTVALLAALLVAPATSAAPDKKDDPRADQAKQALARVEGMLSDRAGANTRGQGGPAIPTSRRQAPDLTMALRDLHLARDTLTGRDRSRADALLARPTKNVLGPSWEPKYWGHKRYRACNAVVCVHYVKTGPHAASWGYASRVRWQTTLKHRQLKNMGYRPPLPDYWGGPGGTGPDRRIDIYLADVGNQVGVYGYAAPENGRPDWGPYAAPGYVVIDNDYSEFCGFGSKCGWPKVQRLMKTTLVHEYFHLVQFGYDVAEDTWFMEATATWIEDEGYDWINDTANFLRSRPNIMLDPSFPLDAPDANPYANWIFFRYLSERFDRAVIRTAWERADAFTGDGATPPDEYSIQAVRSAVEDRGADWGEQFAWFASYNRNPRTFYEEAAGQRYPASPVRSNQRLTYADPDASVNHGLSRLSSATHRFTPAWSLNKNWELEVTIKGNTEVRGGHAVVTRLRNNGSLWRTDVPLDTDGNATVRVPYGRSKVQWVEVTLANASTRNNCWLEIPDTTCQGESLDNNRPQQISVEAVRPRSP